MLRNRHGRSLVRKRSVYNTITRVAIFQIAYNKKSRERNNRTIGRYARTRAGFDFDAYINCNYLYTTGTRLTISCHCFSHKISFDTYTKYT